MIGDPKQAIYGFRGADIFTYIQARRNVSAHYTLGRNWRGQCPGGAVNGLFERAGIPLSTRRTSLPAGGGAGQEQGAAARWADRPVLHCWQLTGQPTFNRGLPSRWPAPRRRRSIACSRWPARARR